MGVERWMRPRNPLGQLPNTLYDAKSLCPLVPAADERRGKNEPILSARTPVGKLPLRSETIGFSISSLSRPECRQDEGQVASLCPRTPGCPTIWTMKRAKLYTSRWPCRLQQKARCDSELAISDDWRVPDECFLAATNLTSVKKKAV
jgi:hypothetical protein